MKYLDPVLVDIATSNIPLPIAASVPSVYSDLTSYVAGNRVFVAETAFQVGGGSITVYFVYTAVNPSTGDYPFTSTTGNWAFEYSSKVFPLDLYTPAGGETLEWDSAHSYDASTEPTYLKYVAVSVAYDGNPATNLVYFNSYVGLNTGNYPPLHPDKWVPVGVINRLKPFDSALNTQAEHLDTVEYVLTTSGASAFALFNLEAVSVTVVVTDVTTSTEVYNNTFNLQNDVDNWYDYFFGGISYRTSVFGSFPVYFDQSISFTITATAGELAKVGAIVVGKEMETGVTLLGASLSSVDLSSTSVNEHGIEYLNEGTFLKQNSYNVSVDTSRFDSVNTRLLGLKNKLRVFVGSEDYESMVTYGFLRRFESVLSGPLKSRCFIDVESVL